MIQASEHVCERRASRIVKVQRDPIERYARGDCVEQARNLPRVADPDGVTDRHLECAEFHEPLGEFDDALHRHRAFERTPNRCGQVCADAKAGLQRRVSDLPIVDERLRNGLIDVALAKGLGRCREDRDLSYPGFERAIEACPR